MIHKRSIKEKLLKGGAWAFSGKVVTAFTGLAVNALLARLLPPEELGVYFLAFSLVLFMAVVAQLGLTQSIVRLVAESMAINRPKRAHLAVLWTLRLAALAILGVSCLFAFGGGAWIANYFFHSEGLSQVVGLVAVWTVVIAFQQIMAEIYRGFHDIRLATIFGGLVTGLLTMIIFFAFWMLEWNSDLDEIIFFSIAAGASSVALSSLMLWKKISVLPLPIGNEINVLEILHLSWPLWISGLMVFVVLQADIWVVGYFLEDVDVALYGAALRIVTLLLITTSVLYSFLPPIIAEMSVNKEIRKLQAILCSVAFGNSFIVFPAFMLLVLFPEFTLSLVYGDYYIQGAFVLSALSIGLFFNVLTGIRGYVLMMTGHEKTQMVISIVGAGINILFCSIGAVSMGINGVAIGALFGTIIQCVLEVIAVKRLVGVWTFATPLYIKQFNINL
ncbi:MAG: flippase [Mariprofundaceae bacterium]|nr:flippase [Mariprofundaceae bacterium]